MAGGATSDSLDPRTITDWVPVNLAYQVMNGFIEIDENNRPMPELLEHWESKPGAADWVFDVRKGVTFSNGKTLDADDIVYSLNLHRGDTKSAAKATLGDITEVKTLGPNQVGITMSSGNVDLPYLLSDYHFFVIPNGWTDWMKPVGTGGYTLEAFEPGIRSITKKRADYWKPGCAHVDAIEIVCINDTTARTNALVSGQVDVINRMDARTVDLVKRKAGFQVIRNPAGQHATFLMNVTDKPYDDNNVRLALKYGIDRQKIIDTVLHGYGVLGNDHPIPTTSPYYAAGLPQHSYDPDKAKFHLKQAGLASLPVTLDVSDAALHGCDGCFAALPGSLQAGRHRHDGRPQADRRLFQRGLDEGAVLRLLLGWAPDRRPDADDRLQVGRGLERDLLEAPRVRQDPACGARGSRRFEAQGPCISTCRR